MGKNKVAPEEGAPADDKGDDKKVDDKKDDDKKDDDKKDDDKKDDAEDSRGSFDTSRSCNIDFIWIVTFLVFWVRPSRPQSWTPAVL